MRYVAALLLGNIVAIRAFVPVKTIESSPRLIETSTNLRVAEVVPDVETARISFFLWFFGASGGAGIARSSFPRMYNSVKLIQSLKGVGPTLGGEKLGISPLCGYPEDICRADVAKVVNNRMTIEQMVKKFPVEGNFLAKRGYITYEAFQKANKDANPLAVRAVFDTFNTSTDVSNPEVAQQKLDAYKKNIDLVKGELLKAKLIGFSSIFTLLFLLGLADVVAFGHARDGWFPDWPGLSNLPPSLFDPEIGLSAIPKYWL